MTKPRATPAPIPLVDPLLGSMLGEYRVDAVLGEGGMGLVYRGSHPVIGKQVAIKVLKRPPGAGSDATDRLLAEARAVNAIGHRGIIDIFSMGVLPDGRAYLVMELLSGESLEQRLVRQGRLAWRDAVRLALELSAPLEAAHRAGVVHRDLKPANVFLCRDAGGGEYVKLLDFGLARRTEGLEGSTAQTNQAMIIGTPNYMAPEQAAGKPVSSKTDVYALGVMLFELLSGTLPFSGSSLLEVALAHIKQPAPSLAERWPDAKPELVALVDRMLAKSPEARPAIDVVRAALQRLLDSAPVTNPGMAAVKPMTVLQPRPPTSRAPLVAAGLGAALLLGGVAVLGARDGDAGPARATGGVAPAPATAAPPTAPERPASPTTAATPPAVAAAPVTPEPPTTTTPSPTATAAPTPPEQPTTTTPSPTATAAPTPPERTSSPTGAPTPTTVAAPTTPERPAPTNQPPAASPTPTKPTRSAPSVEELVDRIARLERALMKHTAGREPDAAALQLLKSYRLKAEMAAAPAERLEVNRKLDRWEKTHLK